MKVETKRFLNFESYKRKTQSISYYLARFPLHDNLGRFDVFSYNDFLRFSAKVVKLGFLDVDFVDIRGLSSFQEVKDGKYSLQGSYFTKNEAKKCVAGCRFVKKHLTQIKHLLEVLK